MYFDFYDFKTIYKHVLESYVIPPKEYGILLQKLKRSKKKRKH